MLVQKPEKIVLRELKKLFPEPAMALSYTTPWELVVAVILSAQSTDKKVNEVTKRLFKKYQTIEAYAQTRPSILAEDIKQLGLYRNKAKHIVAAAQIVGKEYGGKVPDTLSALIRLPGVGRKTANVVLGELYGVATGVAVDTHVARLARKFGLTKHTDPVKIELDLMNSIPQKDWIAFTHRMILYGRTYSPAHKRHADDDPVSRALKKAGL